MPPDLFDQAHIFQGVGPTGYRLPQGGYVTLGCQLLDAEKRRIDRDYLRFPLPAAVPRGETLSMRVEVKAPRRGDYWIKLDLVDEGICWFEEVGSTATALPMTVAASNPRDGSLRK